MLISGVVYAYCHASHFADCRAPLCAAFNVTRHWQNLDYVYMRPDLSFAAHILRTPHYQDTLERMQMQQLPLADFLYIANRIYLGQPSRRLQVLTVCLPRSTSL